MAQSQNRIRPVVYGLAVYFLLSATDCFNIGSVGSLLKVLALAPAMLAVFDLRNLQLRFHPLLKVQLLFWLLAVGSIFYSVSVDRTVSADLTLTMNLALVFLLGLMEQYNEAELEFLKKAMLWGSWVTVGLILVFSSISSDGRLSLQLGESTQDQNYINGYFLYAFSYHCGQFLHRGNRKHLVPAVVLLVVLLMTGSRGALLAFFMAGFFHICVFFASSRNALRNILIVVGLLLTVGALFNLILSQLPPSLAERFTWEYTVEKGTVGRSRIWKYLWNHFSDSSIFRMLFGNGYGTTSAVNQMNHLVAHNLYLDNLITLGIVGMLLQLVTQGIVAWILFRCKEYTLLGTYVGMIVMCLSLSLTAYKPLWNVMLLTIAIDCNGKAKNMEVSTYQKSLYYGS